jgi:hypothetical protein
MPRSPRRSCNHDQFAHPQLRPTIWEVPSLERPRNDGQSNLKAKRAAMPPPDWLYRLVKPSEDRTSWLFGGWAANPVARWAAWMVSPGVCGLAKAGAIVAGVTATIAGYSIRTAGMAWPGAAPRRRH